MSQSENRRLQPRRHSTAILQLKVASDDLLD
jgi:hypothetical protein